MRAFAILLAVLGLTAPARADETDAPDPPKSLTTAFAWSLGTTAAGVGLIALGNEAANRNDRTASDAMILGGGALALVGPSTGHWYAGKILTPGLVVRGLAMGATVGALVDCGDCAPDDRTTILLVGGGVFAAGAILDLVLLPRTVARRNARELVVAPAVTGDHVGITVAGKF